MKREGEKKMTEGGKRENESMKEDVEEEEGGVGRDGDLT